MSFPRSLQIRADFPEGEDAPHPDALRMAEVMREKKEDNGACLFRDLIRAGFTGAQITEHHPVAFRLATESSERQLHAGVKQDRCADLLFKARSPMPNRPPVMPGVDQQRLHEAWERYCQARAALRLDPWSGQRKRAVDQLDHCLQLLPVLPPDRARIVAEVSQLLANTPQASLFATNKPRRHEVHA